MTAESTTAPAAPQDDQAVLDVNQERMERIIHGDTPNTGRFCGYCYARLSKDDQACPVCRTSTRAVAPVTSVPRDALRVYNAHRKKMSLWVNLFAYGGILLSIILSGVMIVYLPNPWNFFAVVMLFFGSWYLANLLGGGIGGHLGMRQGGAIRAAKWQELLQRRAAGENLDN